MLPQWEQIRNHWCNQQMMIEPKLIIISLDKIKKLDYHSYKLVGCVAESFLSAQSAPHHFLWFSPLTHPSIFNSSLREDFLPTIGFLPKLVPLVGWLIIRFSRKIFPLLSVFLFISWFLPVLTVFFTYIPYHSNSFYSVSCSVNHSPLFHALHSS